LQKLIKLHSNEEAKSLYGNLDKNVRQAEKDHRVKIVARNDRMKIMGDKKNVEEATRFFVRMLEMIRRGGRFPEKASAEAGPKSEARVTPPKAEGSTFFIAGK